MTAEEPAARPRAPYPKSARLRLARDFDAVRTRGRRHVGREAQVRVAMNGLARPRLGLATPRRYGGAVRRNRFRRLAREAFRSVAAALGARDFLVEPRRDLVEPTLAGLARDLAAAAGAPPP